MVGKSILRVCRFDCHQEKKEKQEQTDDNESDSVEKVDGDVALKMFR